MKRLRLAPMALVIGLYSIVPLQVYGTDTIIACVKDGELRFVKAGPCKRHETLIVWPRTDRILVDESRITAIEKTNKNQDNDIKAIKQKNADQDAAISALQQGGGSGGLVVKDSLGQLVGTTNEYGATVFRKIGDVPFVIAVDANGLRFVQFSIYYTSDNCSGTPYLVSNRASGGMYEQLFTVDGQTGYYPNLPAQDITAQSFRFYQTPTFNNCFASTFLVNSASQMLTIDLTSLGFVPPFHLE